MIAVVFLNLSSPDNMALRIYQSNRDGTVTRTCYMQKCRDAAPIRQQILACQAEYEIAVLRDDPQYKEIR